jgi:hypothetical protein
MASQLDIFGAPFVKGSETSKAAAKSVRGITGKLCREVLGFIRSRGAEGATDDEIEVMLDLRHQTASARRRELVLLGAIKNSQTKRATRSGRKATVWVVADSVPDGAAYPAGTRYGLFRRSNLRNA